MNLADLRRKTRQAADAANKGMKHLCMADPEDVPNTNLLRRPSGIMQLDVDTAGGIPAGGLSYISGPDGTGKTWLLYNYFAMHQRLYGEMASILYVPVEFLPDYMFMRRIGCQVTLPERMLNQIDEDRVFRRLPKLTKGEKDVLRRQVGIFKILRAHTSEQLLDKLLDAYKRNIFHIIAVDSVSILLPSAEAELKSLEDFPQQAANAALVTRFLQHFHPLTLGLQDDVNTTTLMFTSQVRANRRKSEIGGYAAKYMPDAVEATGAHAARHGKLVDISLRSSTKEKEGSKESKTVIGKLLKWEIIKAKAGSHDNISGEYTFRYSSPGDHIPHLIATAIQYGMAMEESGNVTFLSRDTGQALVTPGGTELKDLDLPTIRNLFESQPDAEYCVRREILAGAGVETCLYR